MGTPAFAVASLQALINEGCNIVAVVTAPDKPAGRGLQLSASEVKKFAVENNLLVLQPEKLKNPAFIETLQSLKADVQIVVAFRMLPEIVWNMPPMGTINVHGSLLPHYRGAAPINWAIINGEKETGVTTFKLKHEIDAGNILLQQAIPIHENNTAGEIHDIMKEVGAALLIKTLKAIAEGTIQEQHQQTILANHLIKHAPKIFTETCKIDFSKSTEEVHNLIRGLSPFPGAFTNFQDKILKIFSSKKEITHHSNSIGTYISDDKTFIKIACANGYIHILDLQLAGKKRMKVDEFLRGNKINSAV